MVATVVVHLIYISGYIFSVSRERWWADKDPATAGSMMENQHINLRNFSIFFLFFTFVWLCFSSLQLEFFGEEKRSLTQTRFESLFNSQRFFGLDSRIDKWIYAFDLFSDRNITSFYGFDYRQRFGCHFFNCAYEDYPHNPILSAALYGGILGGFDYAFGFRLSTFDFNQKYKFHRIIFHPILVTHYFYVLQLYFR